MFFIPVHVAWLPVYWNIFHGRCDASQSPGLTFEGPAHVDFYLEYAYLRRMGVWFFTPHSAFLPYELRHSVVGLLSRSAASSRAGRLRVCVWCASYF